MYSSIQELMKPNAFFWAFIIASFLTPFWDGIRTKNMFIFMFCCFFSTAYCLIKFDSILIVILSVVAIWFVNIKFDKMR